jgi:hypothetical protein
MAGCQLGVTLDLFLEGKILLLLIASDRRPCLNGIYGRDGGKG